MKKAALTMFLVFIIGAFLFSQDYKGKGRILGIVLDQEGKPIEGVTVKLFSMKANQGLEVKTDKDGQWIAAWVRGGGWNIDFEKVGYEPKKISFDASENAKNPEIKINLKKVEGLVLTGDLNELLIKANQLFDQKDYPGALDSYKAMLEKYPAVYLLWKNVGNCYFAQEQYDKAEEAYRKVLEKNLNDTDAMILIGNCYANRDQSDKAMEWYNKIEFEKITDPIVVYNMGNNYYKLSKFEEALKYFKRSVELQKDFLDGLYQLGLAYTSLQRNQEAVTTFETYLKYDADSPRASQVRSFLDYLKKK